eukprot:355017-Chlamydomonas_euryale.AAC.3
MLRGGHVVLMCHPVKHIRDARASWSTYAASGPWFHPRSRWARRRSASGSQSRCHGPPDQTLSLQAQQSPGAAVPQISGWLFNPPSLPRPARQHSWRLEAGARSLTFCARPVGVVPVVSIAYKAFKALPPARCGVVHVRYACSERFVGGLNATAESRVRMREHPCSKN